MNEVYAKSAQEQQLQWQRYKGYCMMMVFWTVLPPKNKEVLCHAMTPATHKSTNCRTATNSACHSSNGYDSIYTEVC